MVKSTAFPRNIFTPNCIGNDGRKGVVSVWSLSQELSMGSIAWHRRLGRLSVIGNRLPFPPLFNRIAINRATVGFTMGRSLSFSYTTSHTTNYTQVYMFSFMCCSLKRAAMVVVGICHHQSRTARAFIVSSNEVDFALYRQFMKAQAIHPQSGSNNENWTFLLNCLFSKLMMINY